MTTYQCPWCHVTESSTWLLQNNHAVDLEREAETPEGKPFYFPRARQMCMAQSLISNHVSYQAKALRDGRSALYSKRGKFDPVAARASLAITIESAGKHRVDHAGIIAVVLMGSQCKPCLRGEHERCQEDAVWSDLADDAVQCACWHREHEASP